MIVASGVGVSLSGVPVLAGVDLTTRSGRVVGLIGPNGSGKSTMLRCLHGQLRPQFGEILVDGRAVGSMGSRALARAVSVVAQDSPEPPAVAVGEFVLLGRHAHRADHERFTQDDHTIAVRALEQVGAVHLVRRGLHELSGGERQRVLIARCIAQQSPTILLDEPTNHLDVRYQHEVLGLVRSLGLTTVVVLHDLNLAGRYCDHLVLLDGGVVVAAGVADDVLGEDVLTEVYGIAVRRLADGVRTHLVFG